MLQDKDLDVSKVADTHQVAVTCSGSGSADTENLLLTETSSASGIFTGALQTSSSSSAVVDDAKISPISSGDIITATYLDQLPLGVSETATITAGFIGHITSSPTQVLTSTTSITITLTEHDLNVDASVADTISKADEYMWYSFDDAAKNYLDLTESSINSAQFISVVSLPSGGAARPPGSRLTVTYMDPDIGSKGAVRSALNPNPSSMILAFGSDGADEVGGFSIDSAAIAWRSPKCPLELTWAAACGPTLACKDDALCGSTMPYLNAAGDYRLSAGSALTVTVFDSDQNRDSIASESVHVSVHVEQSDDSLAAYGSAQNPYCAGVDKNCYLGSNHLSACTNDGDCPGGVCVTRSCFDQVRRKEEQAVLDIVLTETGLNTAFFSGVIYTRDNPEINKAGAHVVHVGVSTPLFLI